MITSTRLSQAIDYAEIKAKELFERGYPLQSCIIYSCSLTAPMFGMESAALEVAVWARAKDQARLRKQLRANQELS